MHLLIRTFAKAGKQGLIAVQKQVTKKGTTFTQTFYVKPESTPKAPNGPTSVEFAEQSMPKIINLVRDDTPYEFASNRPEGGFYIPVGATDNRRAIRVPEKHIASVFEQYGHTFVTHRHLHIADEKGVWRDDYVTSELRTGLGLGNRSDDPEEAENKALAKLIKYPKQDIDALLEKHPDVSSLETVVADTEDWEAMEPPKPLSAVALEVFAEHVWRDFLKGSEGPISLSAVDKWIKDVAKVKTDVDMDDLRKELEEESQEVIEYAVRDNLTLTRSHKREEAINDIIVVVNDSEMFNELDVDREAVVEWAQQNNEDLFSFDLSDYGTYHNDGEMSWSPGDVIGYAMANEVSLAKAQSTAETATNEEEEAEMHESDIENVNFTDSYGKDWDGEAVQNMASWVGGVVKTTREKAKSIDEVHRRKMEVITRDYNPIVDTVDDHAIVYTEGTLYRGTSNMDWLEAKEGQTIPYGMASFSKSESKAHSFGKITLILEMDTVDADNPVMGVDIDRLIDTAQEGGFSEAISKSGLDHYADEQEFCIRSPSLTVLRREKSDAGFTSVWVKPAEMSLLDIMKALFSSDIDLVRRLERTFDYPLHREPEDAWK